jgi:hypothetical protein
MSFIFLLERGTFQARVVEKIKICISYSITFFPRKLCTLWDYVETYCIAGQATDDIRRMRIECWIHKATNTHLEYVTHCFSTATRVARTQFIVMLYSHGLSSSSYPRSDIVSVSTKPSRRLNLLSRVLLITSVCTRVVVALLFTIPTAFRGNWSFERARRKPLSTCLSVCLSFRPRGTAWLILDGFS